ncbi:MAG TPA: sensor histidine kinase [Acidobacteriota bacterium]
MGRPSEKTPAPEPRPSGRGDRDDPMQEILERVRQINRENERLFQQLVAGEYRFRSLAKAVWKVQEEERRRLARELHDGIGQTLSALKIQLERLERLAEGANPDLPTRLADSVELVGRALNETRELSRLLRPPVLDGLGLEAALRWLARTLEQRTGLRVDLDIDGLEERLEPDLETLVFRVVQEALNNVVKHAEVSEAKVVLQAAAGRLKFSVFDGGRGFDAASIMRVTSESSGCGLRGIQDRVELFGGRLELRSRPGAGTEIDIRLPIHARQPSTIS